MLECIIAQRLLLSALVLQLKPFKWFNTRDTGNVVKMMEQKARNIWQLGMGWGAGKGYIRRKMGNRIGCL